MIQSLQERTEALLCRYFPERLPVIPDFQKKFGISAPEVDFLVPSDETLGSEIGDRVGHRYGIITHIEGDMLLINISEGMEESDVENFLITGSFEDRFYPISITIENIHHEIASMIEDGELSYDEFINADLEISEDDYPQLVGIEISIKTWLTRCLIRAMQTADTGNVIDREFLEK